MRTNEKVYSMLFSKVYPMLIAKAERKGQTRNQVNLLTSWLTGYSEDEIEKLLNTDTTYGQFFDNAPQMNVNADNITGSICGVKIQEIQRPTMKKIRQLDKLVDELAKGKTVEKILAKYDK